MKIIGIILTGLITLLSIIFLGYKYPKVKTNYELFILILYYIIAVINGLTCLILIGLFIKN